MTEERVAEFGRAWLRQNIDELSTYIADDITYTRISDAGLTTSQGRTEVLEKFDEVIGNEQPDTRLEFGSPVLMGDRGLMSWRFVAGGTGEVVSSGLDVMTFVGDTVMTKDVYIFAGEPTGFGDVPDSGFSGLYDARRVRFQGVHDVRDWLVKVYSVALVGAELDDRLVATARAAADQALPEQRDANGRFGTGFVIAHQSTTTVYILVCWWEETNEVHQHLYSAPLDELTALTEHPSPAIGCVWELAVTDFERRAWLEHVLKPVEGPDITAYLAREMNEDV